MKFSKMHGLGNDFVLVTGMQPDRPGLADLARRVCDRHLGVGADGLILLLPSSDADAAMVVFNADGSRPQMCGNGIRCLAKLAVDQGVAAGPTVWVQTDAGLLCCEVGERVGNQSMVRVDMQFPTLDPVGLGVRLDGPRVLDLPIRVGSLTYRVSCVGMGNPHAVVFDSDGNSLLRCGSSDEGDRWLSETGRAFQTHPAFPDGVNVHFAAVESRESVSVWTWERGSGATRACGTGACAVTVAGVLTGRLNRNVSVRLPGGTLAIEWADDNHMWMTGPAQHVFDGEWVDG